MSKAYPKMPLPTGNFYFNGKTYPAWTFTQGEQSIKVSTTELQQLLFTGGDTGNDYVNDEAQLLDEQIAFYVSPDDSVETVYSEVWDVNPRKAPYASPVDRIRGIVARLKRPDTKAPWIVKHTHQVYRLDAFDLGDHVAEFESNGDAEHAVACVNAIFEIENILKEVENG